MNGIDWAILALIGFAAVRGFMRGFIIEVCALLGMVLGIWGAIHFSDRVAQWLGLGPDKETITFLVTVIGILIIVHLIGRALTTVIDIAQLGLPNKVAGLLFGAVRKAFVLSVLLNILFAMQDRAWVRALGTQKESKLFGPVRALAPMIIPALGETKWVRKAFDDLKTQAEQVVGE
ncbi:MAG TPA: CvpA family protein [Flavobacteriales bacterium]|nr:CvpA family protein [Flavobacteriales bacterium]